MIISEVLKRKSDVRQIFIISKTTSLKIRNIFLCHPWNNSNHPDWKIITAAIFLKVKSAQCCNKGFTCWQSRGAPLVDLVRNISGPSIPALLEVTPLGSWWGDVSLRWTNGQVDPDSDRRDYGMEKP